jgi:hypothetical protein
MYNAGSSNAGYVLPQPGQQPHTNASVEGRIHTAWHHFCDPAHPGSAYVQPGTLSGTKRTMVCHATHHGSLPRAHTVVDRAVTAWLAAGRPPHHGMQSTATMSPHLQQIPTWMHSSSAWDIYEHTVHRGMQATPTCLHAPANASMRARIVSLDFVVAITTWWIHVPCHRGFPAAPAATPDHDACHPGTRYCHCGSPGMRSRPVGLVSQHGRHLASAWRWAAPGTPQRRALHHSGTPRATVDVYRATYPLLTSGSRPEI